jgi:CHAT domain-containing protein
MWLLDGKKIYPYKIDVTRKTLDSKIQEFKSMISDISAGGNTIKRNAQRLYNILLKPVEKFLYGKPRIAIVPHGSLHYLPFEALMNKGKFLVEKNIKIFYLPSASVYKYCREKNKKSKEKVTAFVNPDGTLPGSEKEVEVLEQLFPGRVEVFSGKKVTESMVKANSGASDILHIACHGKFESEHPLYSGLLLVPDNENDGCLEVSEIFQLQLKPAYLVTLSACETNVGNISPGDEIIGLTRAFIYAGTPSILASLWKVDDLYTAKLMASFYLALKNADKIDALHAARLEIINEPGKRHPFYWAAFVLIGDPH